MASHKSPGRSEVSLPIDAIYNEDIKIVLNLSYFRLDNGHDDGRLMLKKKRRERKKKKVRIYINIVELLQWW